jgi:hypothetical protein
LIKDKQKRRKSVKILIDGKANRLLRTMQGELPQDLAKKIGDAKLAEVLSYRENVSTSLSDLLLPISLGGF